MGRKQIILAMALSERNKVTRANVTQSPLKTNGKTYQKKLKETTPLLETQRQLTCTHIAREIFSHVNKISIHKMSLTNLQKEVKFLGIL